MITKPEIDKARSTDYLVPNRQSLTRAYVQMFSILDKELTHLQKKSSGGAFI
jgi:hypothetical protein